MKIEEVVELILFNLTVYQNKRFYDVLRVIVPYARDNWSALQLSPNVSFQFFFFKFIQFVLSVCHKTECCRLRGKRFDESEKKMFSSFILDEKHELC